VAELERSDWIPFRARMSDAGVVMLGHARLAALDPERPVSFSQPVVTGLVRTRWGYEGVLITDDFSMRAVYASADGLAGAGVRALNAGVDLILVSSDAPQYFTVMDALLRADRAGLLSAATTAGSARRLARFALSTPGRRPARSSATAPND
jgi:beta-N-acetylhexosaminidase